MKRGFTLIELMIVVAIIAIIAAIAIPNLLQSRLLANESAAIGALKTIHTEMNKFKQSNLSPVASGDATRTNFYPQALQELYETQVNYEDATGAIQQKPVNLISSALAAATTVANAYKGYVFVLDPDTDKNVFAILAYPAVYGRTGTKAFYIDEEGTVYSKDQGVDSITQRDNAIGGAQFTALDTPKTDPDPANPTWVAE